MSFSSEAKAEMCAAPLSRPCDSLAELYGMLLFGSVFSSTEIRLTTGNPAILSRITALFDELLQYAPERRGRIGEGRAKTVVCVREPDALRRVYGLLGLDPRRSVGTHINLALLEEDCCRAAFLRGAFLAGGSVTDPGKRYHLELVTPHYNLSREALSLLMEMEFEPKIAVRKSNYVIYFKYSEGIEDFLTKTGAPLAAMHVMEAKVEKEVRNKVNRQVNCETANITKTVDAAAEQLLAIRRIDGEVGLDALPEELRTAARARLAHPELSLSALAATFSPPVSKASLNYRMRKLMAIAKRRA